SRYDDTAKDGEFRFSHINEGLEAAKVAATSCDGLTEEGEQIRTWLRSAETLHWGDSEQDKNLMEAMSEGVSRIMHKAKAWKDLAQERTKKLERQRELAHKTLSE